MIAINYLKLCLSSSIVIIRDNIHADCLHVVFMLEGNSFFTNLVNHSFCRFHIVELLLVKTHSCVCDEVPVGSLKHCVSWFKLGVQAIVRRFVGPLLSGVACRVSQEFLGLDVEDAVGFWIVQVLNIYGQSKVRALAILTCGSDVEADVLTKVFWFEVSWIVVAFLNLKLVFTAFV